MKFNSRRDAGAILAKKLPKEEWVGARVLALPRGGVPVAAPIAIRLGSALEVFLVRKLGAPLQPEFALGALAEDGTVWLNQAAVQYEGVSKEVLEELIAREQQRIKDQQDQYRKGEPFLPARGRPVVLVDDGIATGATTFAAIEALKKQGVSRILVAVPVCARSTARQVRATGAELLSLIEPERLISVGMWYRDFNPVEDQEVKAELGRDPVPARKVRRIAHQIAERLMPLKSDEDLAPLIEPFRNRRVVMLGEATHGTAEFYRIRSRISRHLLRHEGFSFVAVEGDWPDAERLNQYLKGRKFRTAKAAMKTFRRWPTWLWANEELADFIENEREFGQSSFYGLDVYSLFESIDAVIAYTMRVNPFLGTLVRKRYSCFEPFERDEYAYARSLKRFPEGCINEVVENLNELLRERLGPGEGPEERFSAEQNARIVVNAENYYRTLLSSDERSWNIREGHMLDTLSHLIEHSEKLGRSGKAVVWAHNTHVGDYRATDMIESGYVNLGGLARKLMGEEQVALVGFGTFSGRVVASNAWGGREQVMSLSEAMPGTWEFHFHEALKLRKWDQGFVVFEPGDREGVFGEVLGHRAVGVVYHPRQEGLGNYVPTALAKRYDAFVFVNETSALRSIHSAFDHGKFPETWPSGT